MSEELFPFALEPLPLVLAKPRPEKIATAPDLAHWVKCVSVQETPGASMTTPDEIFAYYEEHVRSRAEFDPMKEHLHVFALNTKYKLTGLNLVSMGTINESLAYPREIFRPVIACAAYAFVMVHNHPSGDPTPSDADRRLTTRIADAAKILCIPFLDHIIIGTADDGRKPWFSFRECGLL